jgi:FAD:protein FMN transferase
VLSLGLLYTSLLATLVCENALAMKSYSGQTMGTTYTIKSTKALDLGEVDRLLVEFNQDVSTYIPDSQISKVSSSKGPHRISKQFYTVLEYSLGLAELTDGVFDPTVGPLVRLWGFGPRTGPRKKPSPRQIKKQLNRVGYKKLKLSSEPELTVNKSQDDVEIDLSATAKGYGVDLIYEWLLSRDHSDFMVEIGGEIRVHGLNAEKKLWTIGIETPTPNRRALHRLLKLSSGKALATSGDYRNFFESSGEVFSHTIDPRSGYPVKHLLTSVSVVANTCMHADGLATALMAMGPEKAEAFVVKNNIVGDTIYCGNRTPFLIGSEISLASGFGSKTQTATLQFVGWDNGGAQFLTNPNVVEAPKPLGIFDGQQTVNKFLSNANSTFVNYLNIKFLSFNDSVNLNTHSSAIECEFEDMQIVSAGFDGTITNSTSSQVYRCYVHSPRGGKTGHVGIVPFAGQIVYKCFIKGYPYGIRSTQNQMHSIKNLILDCDVGVESIAAGSVVLDNTIVHRSSPSGGSNRGIALSGSNVKSAVVVGNIIAGYNNTTNQAIGGGNSNTRYALLGPNAFYDNTTNIGTVNTPIVDRTSLDIQETSDPFEDLANEDLSLKSTALSRKTFINSYLGSDTDQLNSFGAVEAPDSGGGGGDTESSYAGV